MEISFLFACFIFLSAALIVVPLAKITGLGPVLGYLLAGILIGPFGLKLVADPTTILHFSEFGVVMMLFLIGLELQPREFWHMRVRLVGLGVPQVLLTAIATAIVCLLLGVAWQTAIITGLGLALSSTAIVLKLIDERGIMERSSGRSAFATLLVQDVAVIPILALIPFLAIPELMAHAPVDVHGAANAHGGATGDHDAWTAGWRTALVFASMYLAGRYLLRPVMHFIVKSDVREIFTALSLLLVVGSALLMNWIGISPALGAFMIGVILADSEYRHELEGALDPFKGLLLGLFFISVGMSIQFSVLTENMGIIAGFVAGLVLIKFLVLYILATIFKMHMADKLLLATLLAQGGEFGFVLFQFAVGEGAMAPHIGAILNVTVALSMMLTPILLIIFDRFVAPRLAVSKTDEERPSDDINVRNRVIVLGYGRFGQITTRLLAAQGFETTVIDHDPEQIELMKKFGTKVFYGDARKLDLLRSAGAAKADIMIVSIHKPELVSEIAQTVHKHFPHIRIFARARDRNHAHDLMDIGIYEFERDTFHSALKLGTKVLVALGYTNGQADRLASSFAKHDVEMLKEAYDLRDDDEAMIGHVKTARELLAQVMQSDLEDFDEEKGPQK